MTTNIDPITMFIFNLGVFIGGLCVILKWNPLGMCNNHISKKFLLGLMICLVSIANMIYFWGV